MVPVPPPSVLEPGTIAPKTPKGTRPTRQNTTTAPKKQNLRPTLQGKKDGYFGRVLFFPIETERERERERREKEKEAALERQ